MEREIKLYQIEKNVLSNSNQNFVAFISDAKPKKQLFIQL